LITIYLDFFNGIIQRKLTFLQYTIIKNFKLVNSGFIVFIIFNWKILSNWYFDYSHIKYFLINDKFLETIAISLFSFVFYIFFLSVFIVAINSIIKLFKSFI